MFAKSLHEFGDGGDCGTSVANTSLVPKAHEDAHRYTNSSASECAVSSIQTNSCAQTDKESPSDGLSYIRKFFKNRNFSAESVSIMCASWRQSILKQYEIYFKKSLSFCGLQQIDPMQYNEVVAVTFLTELFNTGIGYSAINTARSALSTVLLNSAGVPIENCPDVKRFLKGVFELRPSMPKYTFIWDVEVILDFLKIFSE